MNILDITWKNILNDFASESDISFKKWQRVFGKVERDKVMNLVDQLAGVNSNGHFQHPKSDDVLKDIRGILFECERNGYALKNIEYGIDINSGVLTYNVFIFKCAHLQIDYLNAVNKYFLERRFSL